MAKMIAVESLLDILAQANIKVSKETKQIIEQQSVERGFSTMNLPKEIDGVTHYYCRYTAKYYPIEQMIVSNGKSKGYSKIGISAWTKVNTHIKKLSAAIANAIRNDDIDAAKKLSDVVEKVKLKLNDPQSYQKYNDDGSVNVDDILSLK